MARGGEGSAEEARGGREEGVVGTLSLGSAGAEREWYIVLWLWLCVVGYVVLWFGGREFARDVFWA